MVPVECTNGWHWPEIVPLAYGYVRQIQLRSQDYLRAILVSVSLQGAFFYLPSFPTPSYTPASLPTPHYTGPKLVHTFKKSSKIKQGTNF